MYDFDHKLFLALNFDGGAVMDKIMLAISGTAMWIPFYIFILWLVWRRVGWKNMILFAVAMILALVLADMLAGIFKHSGVLKNLIPSFPARLRPMWTPELDGLVHVVREGGRYGTVSSHASTVASVALLSACVIRQKWYSIVAAIWVVVICYSRIYLAYHFPCDLLLGIGVGVITGIVMYYAYRAISRKLDSKSEVRQ